MRVVSSGVKIIILLRFASKTKEKCVKQEGKNKEGFKTRIINLNSCLLMFEKIEKPSNDKHSRQGD